MHQARYIRPTTDTRVEVGDVRHAGPLPPGWLASGFVMNLVVEGEADLQARGMVHRVHRGVVVLSDAGEFRRVTKRHSPVAHTRSLICATAVLTDAIAARSRSRSTPHFMANTSGAPALRDALRRLYAAIDAGDPLLAIESALEGCFDAMAADLQLSWRTPTADRPAVRRVRDLITDRCTDDLSLVDLASTSALSRAHLIRAFAKEFGVTPHQYQLHARVSRARQLLAAGTPPSETAFRVGFCDQSHLTRHFRRMMGVGPAEYRRMVHQRQRGR